ncbi:uncharacterized protein BCR38DRAFT_481522 [Pseudomassariella vexata]|uniref:Uncharacterized protein n=1 Tax=Pseudomassariella vexata TaxID=1141098 RepID=A0A1Y2EFP3_9PEZI|nr:uncharacterized protein BCR38DRAFT_481522 [Pseudomassariella vexata]ORY70390.1 hypothetical protein BCR38DRAFT_481522 [Pseudomassariella vexata]
MSSTWHLAAAASDNNAGVSTTRCAVAHGLSLGLSLGGVNYTTPYDAVVGYCSTISDATKERPGDVDFALRAVQSYLRLFDGEKLLNPNAGEEPKVSAVQILIDDASIPMRPQFEDWGPKNTGVELPERVEGQNAIRFTRDSNNNNLVDELIPEAAYNALCFGINKPGATEGESAFYLRVGSAPHN